MENKQKPIEHTENKSLDAGKSHEKSPKEKHENEILIGKVLEIEKQAEHIHDKALLDAKSVPVKAEQDGTALVEKTRQAAQAEASKLIDQAKVQEQSADILAESEKNIQHNENLASGNLNRAVTYVVNRVIGRE